MIFLVGVMKRHAKGKVPRYVIHLTDNNIKNFLTRGGENVTFSVKKITGSHNRRNFEDNDLIFFSNSQN